ncbi:NAD-dependent epimerase/dehydratase family protein [Pseudolysinimonas sp.]|uniref:NAD-dependent epimerase/dehydratase family protein n=1 Tax=Pseudolysinimonas sp. TaxID=2680009 RepID=UPI003F7FDB95
MTRMLITGGGGFIGGAIVAEALAAGHEVRVLDSFRRDVHDGVAPVDERAELVVGDVRDAETVDRALGGVDVVVHEAAKVGLGVDFSDAPDYTGSNVHGTAVLLAALAAHHVERLVLASSMVVYGEGAFTGRSGRTRPLARQPDDLAAGRFDPVGENGERLEPALIDEDDPVDPRNVYALTKLAQEHLAAAWARSSGGRAIALRYHNVYGPLMPRDTPYAGVASLFRSALARGEAPRVFEDGAQRRDFVHVRDVAGANLAAIAATERADAGSFRAYNVGSGTVHTILDVASALSRETGGPAPMVTGEYRLGDVRHITASSARAARELGWTARIGFDDGMREFAAAPLRGASAAATR